MISTNAWNVSSDSTVGSEMTYNNVSMETAAAIMTAELNSLTGYQTNVLLPF
jgi:hypothetical protein